MPENNGSLKIRANTFVVHFLIIPLLKSLRVVYFAAFPVRRYLDHIRSIVINIVFRLVVRYFWSRVGPLTTRFSWAREVLFFSFFFLFDRFIPSTPSSPFRNGSTQNGRAPRDYR